MNAALSSMGLVGLGITLITPLAYLAGGVALATAQWMMLVGTLLWFAASGPKLLSNSDATTSES